MENSWVVQNFLTAHSQNQSSKKNKIVKIKNEMFKFSEMN